ncbi:PREDICTED: neurotensin receptor type 1 [Condylura cristata]|uniref:neurotensin receptor type 1 n=1 Tax=Condylura cristata TaxID=143302 RepID=UPI000643A718|nr:PREDICTED: neurotensin receptor type 1 [Condylura cristata]
MSPAGSAPVARGQHAAAAAALLALVGGNGSRNASRPAAEPSSHLDVNTDACSKVLVTAVYLALFVLGTAGNSVTAFALARRRPLQHLQGAAHYHLGSLAASDLLILLLAMPVELYNFIWVHHPWAFGDAGCRGYYFLRDACTFATALNVASLSLERYLAVCHPFKAKTLMSRSRTKRLIAAIWLASGLLALPMLFTMGQQNLSADGRHPGGLVCTPTVGAATLKLVIQTRVPRRPSPAEPCPAVGFRRREAVGEAPADRAPRRFLYDFYHYFYMLTNALFYVSSAVNPVLYNLVSASFRQVFLSTLACLCPVCGRGRKGPAFPRKANSVSSNHTLSSHATRESLY